MTARSNSRRVRAVRQLELPMHTWGGARPGAGRPKRAGAGVPHRTRPALSRHHPVHVTLRVAKGVRSLRGSRVFRGLRRALAAAKRRFGFRLVHYSVQSNHIHMLAEADDRVALTRGLQGLQVRVARAINRARDRSGRVFSDRYHARVLKTPLEVRRALVYVLNNLKRHLASDGLSLPPWHWDPCSSASEFDGWHDSRALQLARAGPPPEVEPIANPAQSYLLRVGWRRHGLIGIDEVPGAR
jgi:REP element-mobilizing transposase RayT